MLGGQDPLKTGTGPCTEDGVPRSVSCVGTNPTVDRQTDTTENITFCTRLVGSKDNMRAIFIEKYLTSMLLQKVRILVH